MSVSAPGSGTRPGGATLLLQDAASALAVAAAGADALARVLLLASVAPQLVDPRQDIEPHELDSLTTAAEHLRVALDTFASSAGPELVDRLHERMDWAEGKARHDRTQAIRAAAATCSTR